MRSYRAYTSLQHLPLFEWQRFRALEGLIRHRPVCPRCPRRRVVDFCPIIDNDHGRMRSRRDRNRESDVSRDTVIAYGHRRFNSSHVRYLHLNTCRCRRVSHTPTAATMVYATRRSSALLRLCRPLAERAARCRFCGFAEPCVAQHLAGVAAGFPSCCHGHHPLSL